MGLSFLEGGSYKIGLKAGGPSRKGVKSLIDLSL